jgi:hypothetical protein
MVWIKLAMYKLAPRQIMPAMLLVILPDRSLEILLGYFVNHQRSLYYKQQ